MPENGPSSPTARDYRAAEESLRILQPQLVPGSPLHTSVRQFHAELHAKHGPERYRLLWGLRPPKTKAEELQAAFWQRKLSDSEYERLAKADAERPIDIELLNAFCDATEDQLCAYGNLCRTIVEIVADQRNPESWQTREVEADVCVRQMTLQIPLWAEQQLAIDEFLTDLRAASGDGPVRVKEFSGANAHALVQQAISFASEMWKKSSATAHRSRTDRRYAYAATASALYYKNTFPSLPLARDLAPLLALERASARKALVSRASSPAELARIVHITAETCTVTVPTTGLVPAPSKPSDVDSPISVEDRDQSLVGNCIERPDAELVIHLDDYRVVFRGVECRFRKRQGRLFALLGCIAARRYAISFDELRDAGGVWDGQHVEDDTIKGAVARVRNHLEKNGLGDLAKAISTWMDNGRPVAQLRAFELQPKCN